MGFLHSGSRVVVDALIGLGCLALGVGTYFGVGAIREAVQNDSARSEAIEQLMDLSVPASGPGAPSPEVAVERFLDAELAGDANASFALLSAADRSRYPSPNAWSAQRAAVIGPVRAWEWADDTRTTTKVDLEPGLSVTRGWTPAATVIEWAVVDEDGWRVALNETTELPSLLPGDLADVAAQAWLDDDERCSDNSTTTASRSGLATAADSFARVCSSGGVLSGEPSAPVSGQSAASLALSYGDDPSTWARVVPLQGEVDLVLIALGDDWVVVDTIATT